MATIQEIAQAIGRGKSKLIEGLVKEALAEGLDPLDILNEGMIAAMDAVGEQFQKAEIFVPEMLIAARTMKKGVEVLKPRLAAGGAAVGLGKCIIGTVHGDLHDIGKNLVALMLETSGFEVIDLGVDVGVETFVKTLKENPDTRIVALSCLLTTTMAALKETAEAVRASGVAGYKLIVGGAPVSPQFADSIGADGYSADAAGAVSLAKRLIA